MPAVSWRLYSLYCRDITWASNIKASNYWSFARGSLKASNAEIMSISWRHHQAVNCCILQFLRVSKGFKIMAWLWNLIFDMRLETHVKFSWRSDSSLFSYISRFRYFTSSGGDTFYQHQKMLTNIWDTQVWYGNNHGYVYHGDNQGQGNRWFISTATCYGRGRDILCRQIYLSPVVRHPEVHGNSEVVNLISSHWYSKFAT